MQLKDFQILFLPHLEAFFNNQRQKITSLQPLAQDMFEKLAAFTLRGGKRTRPALLYYSYQAMTQKNPLKLMPLCIACELMQSFLLIHDDIMDQSDLRRGDKTIHQQFSTSDEYMHYGKSMAILIGNLAGYLGLRAIAASDFEAETKNLLMDLYAQTCIDAGYGQGLDISFTDLENLTEDQVYSIYHYKTARYTTEFPLLATAIATNLPAEPLNIIKHLAVELGILFQIKDDVMGLFGDPKKIGKPLDSIYAKKTLLICKAFERGNSVQKKQLKSIYNNQAADTTEINLAKKIILETGSLDYAEAMIKKRTDSALNIIETLQLNPASEVFLKDFVYYCGQRDN
jgi:geranylgeranyl diphosphate synthase type I